MGKLNTFEIVTIAVFAVAAIAAVVLLRVIPPTSDKVVAVPIVIWGTLPYEKMSTVLEGLREAYPELEKTRYIAKQSDRYYEELIEAFASGASDRPDLFLIDQSHFLEFENKVYDISKTLAPSQFSAEFVEGAEVFLVRGAARAVPYTIDPLVLYWNRDHFASGGVASVPKTWTEVIEIVPRLTNLGGGSRVERSGIALGEYDNIYHARAILSALFLQGGLRVVDTTAPQGAFQSDLSGSRIDQPGAAALRFYTDFANPIKTVYTWNRTFERDREAFLGGTLSMYIGYASEYTNLQDANPNLNFDIAELPQRAGSGVRKTTYARVEGFAIPKQVLGEKATAAVRVARILSSQQGIKLLGEQSALPPIRRDLVGAPLGTTYSTVTYASALIARSWLEPSASNVESNFRTMVESVNSGAKQPSTAVNEAGTELAATLKAFSGK